MTCVIEDPMTVANFRALQIGFANSALYPDDTVSMYIGIANSLMDVSRWHELRPLGVSLWVAHFLALDRRESEIAKRGGIPGNAGAGIMSSKSIGSVSASYDVTAGSEDGAGQWNLTTYGRRWYSLARMVGAGGVQITGAILSSSAQNRFY